MRMTSKTRQQIWQKFIPINNIVSQNPGRNTVSKRQNTYMYAANFKFSYRPTPKNISDPSNKIEPHVGNFRIVVFTQFSRPYFGLKKHQKLGSTFPFI